MPTLYESLSQQPINELPETARNKIEGIVQANLGEVFPAAALTVVKDGDVFLNAAWGWIDPDEQQHPVQTDTLFDLASVTKLFTATAFLSLMEEKGLPLDTVVVEVVPEFGASGARSMDGGQDPHTKVELPTPEAVRGKRVDPARVTFRHLLTHTSGLAPWRDIFNAAGPAPTPPDEHEPVPRPQRWHNGLHAICNYPFVGEPGDGIVRYSDLGLMLLGEAAARLYANGTQHTVGAKQLVPAFFRDASPYTAPTQNADLEMAINARVLSPLRLGSVRFNPVRNGIDRNRTVPTEIDPTWRKRRVWGEVHDENACGVGGVAGHAGLFASARDVAALGQAWLENNARLKISPELMEDAKREHANTEGTRRGLGWMLKAAVDSSAGDFFSMSSYGHTGFTGTSLWIDPEKRLVVACLTNRVYPGRANHDGIHAFRRAIHDATTKL
jgi:CubicO group peptidase (beta-lactamase class C family)